MEISYDVIFEILSQLPLYAQLRPYEVKRFASLFEPVIYQDGNLIFNIGEESDALYILYEGHVVLSYDDQQDMMTLARLQSGDFFGEEALLFDDPRYYRATATGRTVLLRLIADDFLLNFEDLASIEEMLEVSIKSRQMLIQVSLPWLHDDEYVHMMTRRHPAILWSKLFAPIVFGLGSVFISIMLQLVWTPERFFGWLTLIIGLLIFSLWLVWTYVDWQNDYFIVTNKRVVWIEKVAFIYESRQEAPLRTIMSVGIHRTRLGTALGYGDVVVTTYVGTIRLREIAHTETTSALIESCWHQSESMNRREEAFMMGRKLHEKLNLPYEEDMEFDEPLTHHTEEEIISESKEPGFLAWLFSDFIRLRYEQDGAITYRKHWFVLVQHIWLPALLMMGAFMALAFSLGGLISFLPSTTNIVVILLVMVAIFLWSLYVYVDWRNDIFTVTMDQIVDLDRKPLGKIRRRSAPLENVLSIEYERKGFWGYVFNFGTVYIIVGNMRLSFDYVYNPSEVQEAIFYRMGERLDKVRQFEIEAERERFSEWIASYHRKTEGMHDTQQNNPNRNELPDE